MAKIKIESLFIYGLLGSLLAKTIEWSIQFYTGSLQFNNILLNLIFYQLIFMLALVGGLVFIISYKIKTDKSIIAIPVLFYFLKEIWNWFIWMPSQNQTGIILEFPQLFAILIEPFLIGLPAGLIVYYLFKKKIFK